MEQAAVETTPFQRTELPATAYPHYQHLFKAPGSGVPTGVVFDSRHYTIMSLAQPAESETPDLNADKEGDRVLFLLDGDLTLQIGENRFRMQPGDAVQIPRGVCFGRSCSAAGAHLLLIRARSLRSFSMYR